MEERRTIIPVDGSHTAKRTLDNIIQEKMRFLKSVTLLHVVDIDKLAYRMIPDFQVDMIRDSAGRSGQLILDNHCKKMIDAGYEVEGRLEFGSPRQTICRIANEEGFQLLIIGRRQSTGEIRDVLFGSVANYVLHNVACPVLLF
jgi:nucleotide-binding universal stress UspA family protein